MVHASLLEAGENGGQFEIDQTKAPVRLTVSDVAHVGVVVAHAVLLQLRKKLLAPRVVEMLHASAAIGGDDAEPMRVRLEKTRHERTVARREMVEDAHFIFEP